MVVSLILIIMVLLIGMLALQLMEMMVVMDGVQQALVLVASLEVVEVQPRLHGQVVLKAREAEVSILMEKILLAQQEVLHI